MLHVGVDTGGTFTNLATIDGGRLCVLKVPSTPDDPAHAVLAGLHEIAARKGAPATVTLGTTVATNALLTGRGARAAFVTTAGFGDVLEIGRQARSELYVLDGVKPPALIPRPLRFEVTERMDARGRILAPLRASSLARLRRTLARRGVEAVAIGFLHSYRRDTHERRAEAALRALNVPITRSSALSPLPREHERFVLAAANARVRPIIARHLEPITRTRARSKSQPMLRVMTCAGGTRSVDAASREAVSTILSGPAAGLRAAHAWWQRLRRARPRAVPRFVEGLATLDVGGTSADCGFVAGALARTTESRVGPYPFALPALEVTSVGAGGGSIARLDRGGALCVGPESAGADPGPACYGKSLLPTVTDAFVVLGILPAHTLLGGRTPIQADRSRNALAALARRAGLSVAELARGIVELATQEMARGIRSMTLARGKDTRRLALFAFGGAGGLFAAALMDALEIPIACVPPAPGALSALGALLAPASVEAAAPVDEPLAAWPMRRRARLYATLARKVRAQLIREGAKPGAIALHRSLDLRYRGQTSTLELDDGDDLERRFAGQHADRYGIQHPDREIELFAARVRGEAPGPVPALPSRGGIRALPRGAGPLTILEESGTTHVPRGFAVSVHETGCLLIRRHTGGRP